jgi:predicted RNA binding protein YcfA (HicA-like mRNA interferase family)
MSPRLPRDVSGADLARLLETYGYAVTRQKGSHLRLMTHEGGEHHVAVRITARYAPKPWMAFLGWRGACRGGLRLGDTEALRLRPTGRP